MKEKNKIRILMTIVLIFGLISFVNEKVFAQDETPNPTCPGGNGFCSFINFQIPLFVDSIFNPNAVAEDHENILIEKQLEHFDLLNQYEQDQITDDAFVIENGNLLQDENDEISTLDDMQANDPSSVDTDVVNSLENTEAQIENGEENNGGIIEGGEIENTQVQDTFQANSDGQEIDSNGNVMTSDTLTGIENTQATTESNPSNSEPTSTGESSSSSSEGGTE